MARAIRKARIRNRRGKSIPRLIHIAVIAKQRD